MLKLVFILIWIILINYSSLSQNNDEFFGINFGLHNYFNNADFKELPGVPNCCPRFGYGYDNNIGLAFFYRSLLNDNFNLQYEIRYYQLSSKFQSSEQETFGTSNGFIEGEFTHYLNSKIDILSLNPSIAYNYLNFNFNFGIGISYFLNKRYDQREQITSPNNRGTFLDAEGKDTGSRIRNANAGNLKSNRDFGISILPKISYQLNLNKDKSIFIEPTVSAEINLFKISQEMNWNSFNIYTGISLVFELNNFNEDSFELLPIDSIIPLPIDSLEITNTRELQIQTDFDKAFNPIYINPVDTLVTTLKKFDDETFKKGKTIIEYDTLVIKKRMTIRKTKFRYDTLGISKSEQFIDFKIKDLNNKEINKVTLNEVIIENDYPILNKIFYKDKQLSISDNFTNQLSTNLPYYNFIDTLSERYKKSKNKISLNLIESQGDFTIDTLRLKLLKNYLNEKKGIFYDDIDINYKVINKNSNSSIIEFEGKDLHNPMKYIDTIKTFGIESLDLVSSYNISGKIDSVKIVLYEDSLIIKNYKLNGIPKIHKIDIQDIANSLDINSNFLKVELLVFTQSKLYNSNYLIKIDNNSVEKKSILSQSIDNYKKRTIINFDYNSTELSQQNIDLLNKINDNLLENQKVEIIGYTDDIGNHDYNKSLSLQRAKEVSKYITNGKVNVKGAGINTKYQSLDTPESKVYARCVEIIITENNQ